MKNKKIESYTYYEQYITGDDLYNLNLDIDRVKKPNKFNNNNSDFYHYDKNQNDYQYFYNKNYDSTKYDNKKTFINNKNQTNSSPIETEMSLIIPVDPHFNPASPDNSESILQLLFPTTNSINNSTNSTNNKENKTPRCKKKIEPNILKVKC